MFDFLCPDGSPVLLLRLAHEGADVNTLAEGESGAPQQHVHGVQVEVGVRDDESVEVVGQGRHVQDNALVLDRHVDGLESALVVGLLVDAVKDSNQLLIVLDDLVQRGELVFDGRNFGLGEAQAVESLNREFGHQARLGREGKHIPELGGKNLLVGGQRLAISGLGALGLC